MSLRIRLVLVFLLLAVLPLGGLVLYSYSTSLATVRQAVEAEAERLTGEMETRMERIADTLDQRVQSLSDLAPEAWMQPGTTPDAEELAALNLRIAEALGDQAAYVDTLELIPAVAMAPRNGGRETPRPPKPPTRSFMVKVEHTEDRQVMRWVHRVEGEDGTSVTETLAEFPVGRALKSLAGDLAVGLAGNLGKNLQLSDVNLEISLPAGTEAPDRSTSRGTAPTPRTTAARAAATPPTSPVPSSVSSSRRAVEAREDAPELPRKRKLSLSRSEVGCDLTRDGHLVGHLKARLEAEKLLWQVLRETDREGGELPFALDPEGRLYVADEAHRPRIETLVDPEVDTAGDEVREERDGWIVVTREDPDSGVRFALAHPVAESLEQVRHTAARNFGWGLLVIGLCFGGILPLSGRLTRNLQDLTDGTERLARGDLDVRVPVRSKDEVGRLAAHFNLMAEELKTHQQRLLEGERMRKEQELERRLLEAENHRKSEELEDARRFQLSLLPKSLPEIPGLELAVGMTTATEVGGDYYDVYFPGVHHPPADASTETSERPPEARPLTLVVGDATGHGTAAGTMVTVVKSLFTARAGTTGPATFLSEAGRMIRFMELGRRAMALTLLTFDDVGPSPDSASSGRRHVTVSSAGMPPLLRHRTGGRVEEIALEGLPLGASAKIEGTYEERTLELEPGETLLVATDGFAELLDPRGEPLGYERARRLFTEAVAGAEGSEAPCRTILDHLTAACRSWRGERPLADDVTFLVVRVG